MAKVRSVKEKILADYKVLMENSKAVYLTSARLTANETTELRKKLREVGANIHVLKNSLMSMAVKNVLGSELELKGPLAGVFASDDVVKTAKIIDELRKQDKLSYVYCILDGRISDGNRIQEIAGLDSREVLAGKLVYLLNYPTVGLARALVNNIERLLYALDALKKTK